MLSHILVVAACAGAVAFYIGTIVLSWYRLRHLSYVHGCEPPRQFPQPENVLGFTLFKADAAAAEEKRILSTALQRFKELGNTWSGTNLGQYFVTTVEPENIKAILTTQFTHFGLGQRVKSFGPLIGRGIFTTDGQEWERSRALLRPNFARDQFDDLTIFERHVGRLIDKLQSHASMVDLQPLFFQLTLDTSSELVFGESVNIMDSAPGSPQQQFAAGFDVAQKGLNTRDRMGPFRDLYRNAEFDEACKNVHSFADTIIEKEIRLARTSSNKLEGRYTFLRGLALSTSDPLRIRSEALNILIAGRDTTAGLLSNMFHALARHPDVWAKIQAEVRALGDMKLDYESLRNLKYLRSVLNEALRLWPSTPSNSRFANRNTTLPLGGGSDGRSPIVIPKGTLVNWSVYSMHRRKDLFGSDAEEFRPERWEKLRAGWEYLPFNGGPRICIGQQFALTQAGFVVVRMAQTFDQIEPRDRALWTEGWNLTLASANGVKVALSPRSSKR